PMLASTPASILNHKTAKNGIPSDSAKIGSALAMLPIGFVLGFWWVIAPLPIVLPIILLLESLGHFGTIVLAFLGIPAFVVLLLAAPWFFGWYGIAASLMFGRFTTAKAKEKALAESIHAYRTKAV
ncbi:UNVERIFIED_ORG: hypothetical protein GGD43_003298, partial [Rhizobium esperanzae]